MRILIKRALVIDPLSKHHQKKRDLFIRNGKIERIGRGLELKCDKLIEQSGLHISPGWCDIGTQIGEPGFEHREDIQTVAKAAISGGYTTLACFPNTNPVLDTKSTVEYVQKRSDYTGVKIVPIGAITKGAIGKDISEMQDMHSAGAVSFSDGRNALAHTGIMQIALQYVKSFDGVIINRPFDRLLAPNGQMHESIVSTSLGMRGLPSVSERIMLKRDILILEYTESRLHAYGISSADSVTLVKAALKANHNMSCSVPALNLLFTDEKLADFETNFKVMPPLRGGKDRKALIRGVMDGTIQCICANHEPLEEERKKLEFANAEFGSTGLQTAFSIANTALHEKGTVEQIVHCFNYGPRQILGLPLQTIEEGGEAELTLFDPSTRWTPKIDALTSKGKNSATLGFTLTGRSIGTIHRNGFHS
jgi:dihydroorotase